MRSWTGWTSLRRRRRPPVSKGFRVAKASWQRDRRTGPLHATAGGDSDLCARSRQLERLVSQKRTCPPPSSPLLQQREKKMPHLRAFSLTQRGRLSIATALASDDNLVAAPLPDGHISATSVVSPISPIAVIVIGAVITAVAIVAITAVRSDAQFKLSERNRRFRSGRSAHLSGECRKSPQSARSSNDYRQFSHLDLLLPTLLPSIKMSPICSRHLN
jgi:hypothetical protein